MQWYLIKYKENLWSNLRVFTQYSFADEYKTTLEKRNTSDCKYMIVVCPHIEGAKHLTKIVEHQLNKINSKVA
jgi:hypothetical protein